MKYVTSLLAALLLLTWLLAGDQVRSAAAPLEIEQEASQPERLAAPAPASLTRQEQSTQVAEALQAVDTASNDAATLVPQDGRWVDPRAYASAEELLSAHWKGLWPEVRAELLAAGLDPESYPYEELRSWNELRQVTADHLLGLVDDKRTAYDSEREAWSDLAGAAQKIGMADLVGDLDPETERATLAYLAEVREQMDTLVTNVHSGLEVILMDSIDQEDLSTVHPIGFPRRTLGTGQHSMRDVAWAHVAGIEGWAYEIVLPRSGYPEFTSWLDEIEELRSKRERYLRGVLGT